ncbi:gamma-type small acid-soluble spore protein [Psychrobacillus sp. FJAT-21963]|uniref:gamma-type small acid-soluble spore protein n=1 Tax=Psychrobacillus sp. FJAT-21963 TaxID=1712028 RepID=UPI0009EBB4EC|nr:gamma-type small acid-soluble spore protein [Psychrobacillus sp. FJAT-21963]
MCTEVKSMKKNNSNQSNKSQEFAAETDIQNVKEQNRQAEMKKQQASGPKANRSFNSNK